MRYVCVYALIEQSLQHHGDNVDTNRSVQFGKLRSMVQMFSLWSQSLYEVCPCSTVG